MVFCGQERALVEILGRRRSSRWSAEWDFETAALVEEKEKNLWPERPRDSSRPKVSIRLTKPVVDKTCRGTHHTTANQGKPRGRMVRGFGGLNGRRQVRMR